MKKDELRYLQRLAEIYPTIGKASTEIINLQSILNLPKGTEHFMSDLHGEYQAFSHVLRNGSGAVRKKIDDVFGHTLSNNDKRSLATLIYYPKEKMDLVKDTEEDMENWYKITLYRLIEICKTTASKYTRSKVRKALPTDYAYVIEELITEKAEVLDKEAYYDSIVNTIIEIGSAENFIIALAELIQRLVVDHLHILGDIYDRGPAPHFIMDRLMQYHSLDIQWGNHDVVWMGAAAGQKACIATVVRNSIRYGNLDILEDGYGINMLPLATFVMEAYKDDPCEIFARKGYLPAGTLSINVKEPIQNGNSFYRRELCLTNATEKIEFCQDDLIYQREFFVSMSEPVMAIHYHTSPNCNLEMSITLESEIKHKSAFLQKMELY